jgi:ParB/RepB/Spo0J family partition protein
MEIENINVSILKPYAKNAKQHTDEQIQKVADSIKAFGFLQPIVVDKHNEIVIGHCRFEAALNLDLKEVPCVRVKDLTDAQVSALRIADNKLNESAWNMDFAIEDMKLLDEELLKLTGFDSGILDLEYNFKNTELDQVELGKEAGDYSAKKCPSCGYEF